MAEGRPVNLPALAAIGGLLDLLVEALVREFDEVSEKETPEGLAKHISGMGVPGDEYQRTQDPKAMPSGSD